MARGLLLLDVDGPLNPYAARRHRRPAGFTTHRLTSTGHWYTGREARRHKGLRVWLNPDHGALLRALAERADLEPVWATTWAHQANTRIAPVIGLPELPVIEFSERDLDPLHGWRDGGSWKWSAVARYAGDRPLAWLDDELDDRYPRARARFEAARAATPTLLCDVDPRVGLREEHAEQVEKWAAGL
ncbi:hypothetical protein GCM10022243_19900 [Saccharothrix violaceirubra]|uniref:Secreted protein n=1 Tax=Saccharothrix violaceirubra TaxID=413306 RepID=A0A7W7WVA9_9PSEU|nr:HAD domain-containing protein [Saccharothrix violaceirubra]MBB4965105.1 hypothetical protein [Saccharothrix violaceirubra]